MDKGLPHFVRFLSKWYSSQELSVNWNNTYSKSFGSNRVRQGGVLSPVLFSIYLDSLLSSLEHAGIGCCWGGLFAGVLAYADDIVLLSPSLCGLRYMLKECESFASDHGLSQKTQFIQFSHRSEQRLDCSIVFCGRRLPVVREVIHLGHILTYNLKDNNDVISKCKDMVRKANALLCSFPNISPVVMTYLFRTYCLSLYGSALWILSTRALKTIEISFNKILRRIWRLPYNSHTRTVHCTSHLPSIYNVTINRSSNLYAASQTCDSPLVKINQHPAATPLLVIT